MKKFLSYILIVLVFVNFFAPVYIGLNKENHQILISKNAVEAEETKYNYIEQEYTTCSEFNYVIMDKSITINNLYCKLKSDETKKINISDKIEPKDAKVIITLENSETNNVIKQEEFFDYDSGGWVIRKTFVFKELEPSSNYSIKIELGDKNNNIIYTIKEDVKQTQESKEAGSGAVQAIYENNDTTTTPDNPDPLPACNPINGAFGTGEGTFMGCIAQLFYYVLFVPTSYVFALTGNLFDWVFAYSINDDSYRSAFVVQGWGVLRDVCNIFFIFILLYIAFKTILNLKSGRTKELVVNVIIIGLFINFSLFATRIIIDTSNILARVFYNSNVIQATQGGANGIINSTKSKNTTNSSFEDGIIPLSAGLVNKVNPQNLIINAGKAVDYSSSVKSNATSDIDSTSGKEARITAGNFIIITILASIVNVVGLIVFFSVSIIFVSRVVGLWIMMILSPLVFLTYTIPETQNMKTVGWKKWWPELLSLSFLAPVFIFFLYVILQFLETGLNVISVGAENKTGIAWVVGITVPFIFIMVLLNKAKSIAKDMSGEIGQQVTSGISKGLSAVGGVAIGAATGGAALAMRGTLGKAASSIANSGGLQEAASKGGIKGFMASKALKVGQLGSKSSFDIRNTKAGQMANKEFNKGTGLNLDVGKGRTGGYTADIERQVKKNDERTERTQMSGPVAIEQDKKAKEWKENYEKAMYAERLEVEGAGKTFNESKFKEDYTATNKEIKSSAQINKERLESRKGAIENGKIKTGFIPNKDVKSTVLENLEKKIGGPKNKLTPREEYYTKREKMELEIDNGNTSEKITKNTESFVKIAKENNIADSTKVKEEDIKKSVDKRQKEVTTLELETNKMKNEINNFKGEDTTISLNQARKEYNVAKKEQEEIKKEFDRIANNKEELSQDLIDRDKLNTIRLKKAEVQKNIKELKENYINKQAQIRDIKQEISEFSSLTQERTNLEKLNKQQNLNILKLEDKLNGKS